jgi:hypothetical protein
VRTERIVFAVAAAAVLAHLVDHLIVGVEMDLQFDSVLACGAITAVAAVAYPRLPWPLQAVGRSRWASGGWSATSCFTRSPQSATAHTQPTTPGSERPLPAACSSVSGLPQRFAAGQRLARSLTRGQAA